MDLEVKNSKIKRAIILAAGSGRRLSKYAVNIPKGMLEFNGKALIEWQVNALRKTGIEDIIIVTGYEKEKINFPDVTYFHNENYETTNMLESLMQAKVKFDQDLIVCYADILYTPLIVNKTIECKGDIIVAVDEKWKKYWFERYGTTETDLESLTVRNKKIIELGKPVLSSEEIEYRYIGLLKFTKKGLDQIISIYDKKKERKEKWEQSGNTFQNGYMTDLLNELIVAGIPVIPAITNRGWIEFDTNEDYERHIYLLKSGLVNTEFFINT